ncbi:MAG TPA: insulinase family protein, partial [Caldilineaceae bacterium]|nr:insulinase family protein [Caldilineaceae bacterium]
MSHQTLLQRLRDRRLALLLALLLTLSGCQPIRPVEEMPEAMPPAAEETPAPADEPGDAAAAGEMLPVDPAVRMGVLENGLTYYVRANDEPMNRAELYLAINAGSVLEDEDQKGLAHFLEHMLFNGTENFPGMGVVDFLESIGMAFGPDVNAYTSFDETVYTIQVPTDDPEAVRTAFQVLEDWAAYATLDPAEIEAERGVIVEEWRLRQQTAAGRIQEQTLPFLLGDSRYAERRPIGDVEVVRSAPPEAIRRFYEQWYRPDLMAVIAVGDFDVDEIEALIHEHFADLENPPDAPPRPTYDLPSSAETQYLTASDPEETTTRLWFIRRRPAEPVQTQDDLREDVVTDLFYLMLNERLDDIERQPDAPFLSASAGSGSLVRPVELDLVFAQTPDGRVLDALETITTEVERARRYGFTESELARAKAQLLNFYQQAYNERENTPSADYADEYLRHFLVGEAIPSIEYLYQAVEALLPAIDLAEVNQHVEELAATDNRYIYVTGPEKADAPLPAEEELAATVENALAAEIEPPVEQEVTETLIENPPAPAEIVAQTERPDLGITIIELANGVEVWMKPTDFKDDEVVFSGFSPGGSSLVSDEDFPEAALIDTIVDESGVGPFTASELSRALAGKTVSAVPYIRELTEGIEGSAAPRDLETLFQLIHLYFTQPRADESTFEVVRNRELTRLRNRAQDPNAALEDAYVRALYGDTIRRGALPVEEVEALDLERGFEIYQDRFSDASDFTFVFVGSFDEAELTQLAQTYLGTLPATEREETWQDVSPALPTTVITDNVYAGEGERSIVQIVFTGPVSPTAQAKLELNAVAGVLDILLREELREARGGVYSSAAYAFTQDAPDPSYFVVVSFATDPARVDELVEATFDQIEQLKSNGPTAEDVTKVRAQALATLEEQLETNSFWLQSLKDYIFYGGEDRLDFAG